MSIFHLLDHTGLKALIDKITNYFYTKTQIDDMLSAGMKYEVVEELPATGVEGTIYLVPSSTSPSGDIYDEYIYVDGDFEKIGTTKADLANVVKVPTAGTAVGDTTHPVYVDADGEATAGSQYAGGTKLTLNGTDKGADSATAYAPTAGGTAGQYLKSNGNGNAPSWETMDSAPTANSTKAVTSGGVKTALDGKQASVTITTNTDTPTDNDTVIMQDSGNTGTTSFLRRKLSTLWDYFRTKKFPEVNIEWGTSDVIRDVSALDSVSNYRQRGNALPSSAIVYERSTDGGTTWVDDSSHVGFVNQTDRLRITIVGMEQGGGTTYVYCMVAKHFIDMRAGSCHYALYGINDDNVATIITEGRVSGNTHPNSIYAKKSYLGYRRTDGWAGAYIKHRFEFWQEEGDETNTGAKFARYVGFTPSVIWLGNNTLKFGVPYEITTDNTNYKENVKFPQNVEATKFVKTGGTSSQYLRADGSTATLATAPTSGSSNPITAGGVYTALQNKQSTLTITIPDNSGYKVLQLIADVTDSFNTPNYNISGLMGYIYQWRYGATGSIPHRITAIGGHDAGNVFLYSDSDFETRTILPYLVKYDNRYYIALKKAGSSRSGIRLVGYWSNLLATPINLYANSTASKWYSDSGRTTEVTFEIVKSYSRYPNAYLDFGGSASQVVLGTGELKTIDSSVASGSSNLVTSGAVATAIAGVDLSGKVNLQPDFTVSQIDYSASNVGKWQKVLRFPDGADLVINMKKTAMGSDTTSTLWYSSSSIGESYTSLFGNHSVRFVRDGGYVFLVLACRKSTNEPIESYTFQIAHSSVPMSDIVAVTDASPITATPKEPNIVYRAPMTTGAVSFDVSNGAGSVAMANHNDFVGNMTSEATNGVVVTMSGATEGQIYRFVFTRNITGGVTFKQSNVAYCTIQGDVNAGDTITLTAVSNTADGWLYEQESAGIESSDGSNIIEYNGSTADVRVNWDKLPADVVRNSAYTDANEHDKMAIGRSAQASGSSATAIGRSAQADGYQSASCGCFSQANGYISAAFGSSAKANAINAVALGVIVTAGAQGATAIGVSSTANGINSLSVGKGAEANYDSSIAVGPNAVVCKRSVDANDNVKYRRFRAMNLQSYTVDGEERKFYKPATTGDVTITLSGGGTATVNVTNGTLFIVNDSYAPDITLIFNGIMIDGKYYNTMDGTTLNLNTFTVTPIAGLNAWAIDIKMPLAYIDTSEVNDAQLLTEILSAYSAEGCAFGSLAKSYGGYAFGRGAVTTFTRQTVVGQYNVPSDSDYFQVGYGNGETNRKNILTIDSNERLKVCSYVGGVQEIDMNQQNGTLSNITKSVYRIRWNDTGTVTLSLSGGVEGQRMSLYAETNDVQIFATNIVIPQGRFADFLFVNGAWHPMVGY